MKNTNVRITFKPITRIFQRYHLTIFIVFVAAGLSFAVFSFTNLLDEASSDTTYTSPIGAGSIDQATLERIKALHTSDDNTAAIETRSGRINPFAE
jgi:hypothetical protein